MPRLFAKIVEVGSDISLEVLGQHRSLVGEELFVGSLLLHRKLLPRWELVLSVEVFS